VYNQSASVRFYDHGHWLPNRDVGFVNLSATRWLIERTLRDRLLRVPGVSIAENRTFQELVSDSSGRVSGLIATTPGGESETFEADLVVDCTGRGSRTRASLGHGT
jgi:2-polyprenyl-6-methoxyphenol hydroxylase-like FAD-dependent oxidoreductase